MILQQQDDEVKWVTHYSSDHQILLVGEGDFSFSLSLAKSFGSAANIVASSLNSYDDVIKMYKHAKSNLDDLHKLGACLLHGVDATKMKLQSDLKMRSFDRVIFNFPHAGFHGREDDTSLIKKHKVLVRGFFNNASRMLRADGEIHVSHKNTAPFTNWNIEQLAKQCFLKLKECVDFKREDYPGYNNKRGDGHKCDEPFPLGVCCTYKFICNRKTKPNHMKRNQMMVSRQQTNLPIQKIENAVEQLPISVHLSYNPQTNHFPKIKEADPSIFGLTNTHNIHTSIPQGHFNSIEEVHGRGVPSGGYSAFRGPSLSSLRTLQPMEPLQSLQPCPTASNVRHSLTDHVRTMNTFSHDSRNEGYQVYGGSSNYLRDEFGRTTAHRASYSFDGPSMRDQLRKWPTSTNVGYFWRDHVRSMDTVPLSLGARNEGYQVCGGRSIYLQELSRTMDQRENVSFDESLTLRDTSLKWPTVNHVGHCSNNHVRPMDAVPLSFGARNEGYQGYGGSSNYWQEEVGRTTAHRASYSFDRVRFDRYIAEAPWRTAQSELHRMNNLMP
ncbi:uncharacterized protein LOC109803398 [Cajanus cajan]|uniref:Uncharacterized protein At4g26480 n=1 Tax=Cajanus cajan TaxID=3821 RepID=A0A151UAG3_CAJCA|nr:uncharacterized protein LOC109803398 [Cajanus cajan]KYP76259.1 Uncharacterized protein At4g26480 [Cajanus cajan]